MHTVHLNGADAQKIADLMGGVLIMHNVTDDTALISGGDPSKIPATAPIKTLKFVGIDSWNRPVFKNTEAREFYGSVHQLFSFGTDESEVLAKIDESDLCYFGSSFGCEPMGTPARAITIQR